MSGPFSNFPGESDRDSRNSEGPPSFPPRTALRPERYATAESFPGEQGRSSKTLSWRARPLKRPTNLRKYILVDIDFLAWFFKAFQYSRLDCSPDSEPSKLTEAV